MVELSFNLQVISELGTKPYLGSVEAVPMRW